MTERAFAPPRFVARLKSRVTGRWGVWDAQTSNWRVGKSFATRRGAERAADSYNKLVLMRSVRTPATQIEKLRGLNYAGDPAPIRQYKD